MNNLSFVWHKSLYPIQMSYLRKKTDILPGSLDIGAIGDIRNYYTYNSRISRSRTSSIGSKDNDYTGSVIGSHYNLSFYVSKIGHLND